MYTDVVDAPLRTMSHHQLRRRAQEAFELRQRATIALLECSNALDGLCRIADLPTSDGNESPELQRLHELLSSYVENLRALGISRSEIWQAVERLVDCSLNETTQAMRLRRLSEAWTRQLLD